MDNSSYFRFDDDNKTKQYILSTITRELGKLIFHHSSDLKSHRFEMNDINHNSPLYQINPDPFFYNSINFDLSLCKCYWQSSFSKIVSKMTGSSQMFSYCYLNIRSIENPVSPWNLFEMFKIHFFFHRIVRHLVTIWNIWIALPWCLWFCWKTSYL